MLKERLRMAVRRCSSTELDQILGTDAANAKADLESTLRHSSTSGLLQLRQAILAGSVIRNSYCDSAGRGCLMHWLVGAIDNETLWANFEDDVRLAEASRTVRLFDRQTISLAQVQRAVNVELARRDPKVTLHSEPMAAQLGSHLVTPAA
jgi:hypothetical protein